MARNPYGGEGTGTGTAFLRTPIGGTFRQRVRGDYAARLFNGFIERYGIVQGVLNELACTISTSRVVTVATGDCWTNTGEGYPIPYYQDEDKTLTLDAVGTAARVDAIVVRYTASTAVIELAVVKGNEGGGRSSTIGNLQANDQVLAYATVPVTGDPTIQYESTRFMQVTSPQAEGGAAALGVSDIQSTKQRFEDADRGIVSVYNGQNLTQNATKRWFLDSDISTPTLIEMEDNGYNFARNGVADRTFGDGSIICLFGYWDNANSNQWVVALMLDDSGNTVARGHIVESATTSRVTTGAATPANVGVGGSIPDAVYPDPQFLYGVQQGEQIRIICGSGSTGTTAAILNVSVTPTPTSITVVLSPSPVSLAAAAGATWYATFAGPGANNTVLAAYNVAADQSFHALADNGEIEQWNISSVKQAGVTSSPIRGSIKGQGFDLETNRTVSTTADDTQVFERASSLALGAHTYVSLGFTLPDDTRLPDASESYRIVTTGDAPQNATFTRAQFLALTVNTPGDKGSQVNARANAIEIGNAYAIARDVNNNMLIGHYLAGTRTITNIKISRSSKPVSYTHLTLPTILLV